MTCKVIVCRVGEDPKIEEVENPFEFCQNYLINGSYVEAKLIVVNDKTRVVAYWDENAREGRRPFNRDVPARALSPIIEPSFVVDTRSDPPEAYAKPGEMGFFPVLGNFLITKANDKGDHISLTDEEIKTLVPLLTLPKCKQCKINPLAYREAKYCGAACSQEAEFEKP